MRLMTNMASIVRLSLLTGVAWDVHTPALALAAAARDREEAQAHERKRAGREADVSAGRAEKRVQGAAGKKKSKRKGLGTEDEPVKRKKSDRGKERGDDGVRADDEEPQEEIVVVRRKKSSKKVRGE